MVADPNFIPLFIPDSDLLQLPPVRIFAAEHDVLKNDAQMFFGKWFFLISKDLVGPEKFAKIRKIGYESLMTS